MTAAGLDVFWAGATIGFFELLTRMEIFGLLFGTAGISMDCRGMSSGAAVGLEGDMEADCDVPFLRESDFLALRAESSLDLMRFFARLMRVRKASDSSAVAVWSRMATRRFIRLWSCRLS